MAKSLVGRSRRTSWALVVPLAALAGAGGSQAPGVEMRSSGHVFVRSNDERWMLGANATDTGRPATGEVSAAMPPRDLDGPWPDLAGATAIVRLPVLSDGVLLELCKSPGWLNELECGDIC